MKLAPDTRLGALLQTHPYLEGVLVRISDAFSSLQTPAMRQTLCRFATLQKAARMAELPLLDLQVAIARAVLEEEGIEVTLVPEETPDAKGSAPLPPPSGHGIRDPLILSTGLMGIADLDLVLQRLPLELTFVGPDDRVAYYTDTPHRLFPRSAAIIGRDVRNCHPGDSIDIVEAILAAFRSGERNDAEFWIELDSRFLHIRYLAVRDAIGLYRGCLEVLQDVTEIRALDGENRLLDWH